MSVVGYCSELSVPSSFTHNVTHIAIRAGRGPARDSSKHARDVYCLCCLLIPWWRVGFLGGITSLPGSFSLWLAGERGWCHRLAPRRTETSARPQLRGNNPWHIEAITAPYKSICFGLNSDLLPTPWRGPDSVGLWFSFLEMGAVSLELGRDAALAANAML